MLNFARIHIFVILSFFLPHLQAQSITTNFILFQKETDDFCPTLSNSLDSKSKLRILREGLNFNDNDDNDHHDDDDIHDETYDNDEEGISETAVTLRLYGNTVMGYYYVTLFFGSQLQRQNLIVDTGSTITTIPCTGIKLKFDCNLKLLECGNECGKRHFNEPFDPKWSTSNENFQCNERFSNYICNDCQNRCPFQIVNNFLKLY